MPSLSPSLHLDLNFRRHLTFLKSPAYGNLPVPMATFIFGTTGLLLGPGSGSRRRHSGHIFPGWAEKAAVSCHVRKHYLISQPPGEFSCLIDRGHSILSPKSQEIPC